MKMINVLAVDVRCCLWNMKLKKHNTMNYKKEEVKEKWLRENSHKSQLLGNRIIPMRPDVGFFIKVGEIDVPENIFKEEYDMITSAYFSVMKKLDDHYKKNR